MADAHAESSYTVTDKLSLFANIDLPFSAQKSASQRSSSIGLAGALHLADDAIVLPSALTQDGPCASSQMTPSDRASNEPALEDDADPEKEEQVQSKPWKVRKADWKGTVFWPIDEDGKLKGNK